MAEESTVVDDVKKKVLVRPPNRRRYEEQMEQLTLSIHSLEAELKSYGRPQQVEESTVDSEQREHLVTEQKRLREEKDASISKRKALDDGLKFINEHISKQSDALSKLDAGLAFKTESAFDDAIRKLEYQLNTRHFKLSEENRIVKEIDSLRRSKKKVKEYLQQKQLIDAQRAQQKAMKDERNKYFRLVTLLKGKEDEVKKELLRFKSKTDEAWTRYREAGPRREALKKEIDECYERRRHLTAEFKQHHSKYLVKQKQQRAHSFRRKEEERRSQEELRKKQWQDYEASREPYEDERQLCSALGRYLQRYLTPDQDLPLGASALSPVQSPTTSASFPIPDRDQESEYVILKKKTNDDEEVFLPATSAKKKRAIRKQNRKSSWLSKPIRHTAQIFSQFESLGLRAPSVMVEVPDAIQQLAAKKDEFEAVCSETKASNQRPAGAEASQSAIAGRTSAPSAAPVADPTNPPEALNSEHDDADSDCVHCNLRGGTDTLPVIDIQSARSAQLRRASNSGLESAPETPNSDGSAPRDAEGDGESVDSGIGIHRLKGSLATASIMRGLQDMKCTDSNASSNIPKQSNQRLEAPPSSDGLLQSHGPIDEYIERRMVSILGVKPAQFSLDNDLILEDSTL